MVDQQVDTQPWLAKAQWARFLRDASLAKVQPPLEGLSALDELPSDSTSLSAIVLSAREIHITEAYGIAELLTALRTRKLSVEEVTRAFLRRAALAQIAVSLDTPLKYSGKQIRILRDI